MVLCAIKDLEDYYNANPIHIFMHTNLIQVRASKQAAVRHCICHDQ